LRKSRASTPYADLDDIMLKVLHLVAIGVNHARLTGDTRNVVVFSRTC